MKSWGVDDMCDHMGTHRYFRVPQLTCPMKHKDVLDISHRRETRISYKHSIEKINANFWDLEFQKLAENNSSIPAATSGRAFPRTNQSWIFTKVVGKGCLWWRHP